MNSLDACYWKKGREVIEVHFRCLCRKGEESRHLAISTRFSGTLNCGHRCFGAEQTENHVFIMNELSDPELMGRSPAIFKISRRRNGRRCRTKWRVSEKALYTSNLPCVATYLLTCTRLHHPSPSSRHIKHGPTMTKIPIDYQ
jgi:hypothetical protein